jgi:hypothetical protein
MLGGVVVVASDFEAPLNLRTSEWIKEEAWGRERKLRGDLVVSNLHFFYVFTCSIPHSFEFETMRILFSANLNNEKMGFKNSWN